MRFEAALFLTTVEAKTRAAGQKLGSGEPALQREPLCHRKRSPRSTEQHLAALLES